MQVIWDIWDQGKQLISPFFKETLDTVSSSVGEGNNKGSYKVVKAAQEIPVVKNSIFSGILFMDRQLIRLAGLSGAIAVGLGAYGAHVVLMNKTISEEQKNSFRTASMYHFFGTFGIVAASLGRYPLVSGGLMALGTTVFCGSCYYYGLTGDETARKMAPFGGMTLIAAWLSLIL